MERVKLIYQDNNRDIALTGQIISEDDVFITFKTTRGDILKIGKRFIIAIKPSYELD